MGQTTRSIEDRWEEHCKPALKSRSYLSNAIQVYGKQNFTIEILSSADCQEDLDKLESKFIEQYKTMAPHGYNLRMGGNGGAMSEETKIKIGKASKGRKLKKDSIRKRQVTRKANYYKVATYNETSVKCGNCEEWKDRKEFNKNKSRHSGVQSYCKECRPKCR